MVHNVTIYTDDAQTQRKLVRYICRWTVCERKLDLCQTFRSRTWHNTEQVNENSDNLVVHILHTTSDLCYHSIQCNTVPYLCTTVIKQDIAYT